MVAFVTQNPQKFDLFTDALHVEAESVKSKHVFQKQYILFLRLYARNQFASVVSYWLEANKRDVSLSSCA